MIFELSVQRFFSGLIEVPTDERNIDSISAGFGGRNSAELEPHGAEVELKNH